MNCFYFWISHVDIFETMSYINMFRQKISIKRGKIKKETEKRKPWFTFWKARPCFSHFGSTCVLHEKAQLYLKHICASREKHSYVWNTHVLFTFQEAQICSHVHYRCVFSLSRSIILIRLEAHVCFTMKHTFAFHVRKNKLFSRKRGKPNEIQTPGKNTCWT